MSDLSLTPADVSIILDALEVLSASIPASNRALQNRIADLALRFTNKDFGFTIGELRNICIGLEFLLQDNPMNYGAFRLFSRLSALCGYVSPDL